MWRGKRKTLLRAISSLTKKSPASLDQLLVDVTDLAADTLDSLPRQAFLSQAKAALDAYNGVVTSVTETINTAREAALASLNTIEGQWRTSTQPIHDSLEGVLRALQPEGIDGDEYLKLRRENDRLTPLTARLTTKESDLERLVEDRTRLLIDADDRRAAHLRDLKKEARKVNRSLTKVVRATVRDGDDRTPLTDLLSKHLTGRLDRVKSAINAAELLTPRAFVETCRNGPDAIMSTYPAITRTQAETLAKASAETLMLAEEVELPISTDLELNVGTKRSPVWRSLDHLSTGQKATALLLLLLHRGDAPLIIDQPEDDLDNRFIYEDVVPRLRDTKGRRQLIFFSHNANIPVLGDADQIVTLVAEDSTDGVSGRIVDDGLGSIDHPKVRMMVEELLEGGREAFNTRRYLYGF
jgi:hypothetical protein